MNRLFEATCEELNERFKRAKLPLSYHNGFIQIVSDPMTEEKISKPFWELIANSKWKNVEIDMMEAIDRRESAQRDPAFYAAKALESVIKIISKDKGWTRGNERGASQFIDNLQSVKSGAFITDWEADCLRLIFGKVRNELGHGPGGEPMPELTLEQTDWVIEAAMSWTKSLIERM
ncbi:Hypothetical protein Rta_02910 [Ramlibacter tataouinensis TTB310]|uniref:DUF4145 domain-containing protein n=2 Tax=Ramlibacter tataouinensis TaxID=94132 RepID=F5Y4N8_RAMTT|nr:Hypothetical protein Rta_02910 [Ramlibacter tataouinensis TTB310]